MRTAIIVLCTILIVACVQSFADNWQSYDNFESGIIAPEKWGTFNQYGGNAPTVTNGQCILSGIDTDGTTEAANWEDAAYSSIYTTLATNAVRCDINAVSVVFNNDSGQGQTGDFEISFYADLSNGMFCSIKLFDSGTSISGNASVEDDLGNEISAAAFSAAYNSAASYAIEIDNESVMFKKNDSLLLNWGAGEQIGITGFSFGASAEFCEYNISLDNVLVSDDPDYGNSAETAQIITADSTTYYGNLATSSDDDWFYFEKSAYQRFRFVFTNSNYNWKYLYIYQKNEFGDVIQQTYISAYFSNGPTAATLYFEPEYDCYMKVEGASGNYSLKIDYLDTTAPDFYGDLCSAPTTLTLNTPTTGTLDHTDPEEFDTDWFVFNTQSLHRYQINLTRAENSDAYFYLYEGNCGDFIASTTSYSIVSWFGESYNLRILGDVNRLGQYYTINVTDMGLQSDDYGNTDDYAQPIAADGQEIHGNINYNTDYNSDRDWFVFTPMQNSRYLITFTNAEYNWKYLYTYQQNEFGDLIQQNYISAYLSNGSSTTTLFFEPGYDCYIKLEGDGGDYSFKVEYIDTTPYDSYGKSCAEPTTIFADAAPTIGTLDHTNPTAFDSDYFVLGTLPLHKYQIILTRTDNSDAYYYLYTENCGTFITGTSSPYTVMSWFGESYSLKILGDSNRIGHYYTIEVVDLGLQSDDWPNIYSLAPTVAKDGSWIDGILNYAADYKPDVDWVKFVAGMDGSYTLKLNNLEYNWKYLYIYRINEIDEPVQVTYISAYLSNGISSTTLNLAAGLHYIKVEGSTGNYQMSILSPEPRCGDLEHPYPMGDVNQDCYFNLNDISMMAADWLQCTDPNPPCEFQPL